MTHPSKWIFFSCLYIISFLMVYGLRTEIGIFFDLVGDVWRIIAEFLQLEWSLIFFLLIGIVLKLIFYSIYLLVVFCVWFFVLVKLNWINLLVILPLKRGVIYAVTSFSLVEKYKNGIINYGRNQFDSAYDGFIQWPLSLRLFSFPAVILFTVFSFLFFVFWNAVKFLVANKLGDKFVEIVFRKVIMVYPKSRAIVQPILEHIEKGVDTLDAKLFHRTNSQRSSVG